MNGAVVVVVRGSTHRVSAQGHLHIRSVVKSGNPDLTTTQFPLHSPFGYKYANIGT